MLRARRVGPSSAWARVLVVAVLAVTGCSPDPPSTPGEPLPADQYQEWLDAWKTERNGMSSEWAAVVNEFEETQTPGEEQTAVSMDVVRTWSARLDTRASQLADRLRQVGTPPDSPITAPGLYDTLIFGADTFASTDLALQSCTQRCDEPFEMLTATGSAMLDLLVLGVRSTSATVAVRTTSVTDALLDGDRLGLERVDEPGDPLDFLCRPDFLDAVDVTEPDQSVDAAFETTDAAFVRNRLSRWDDVSMARRQFQSLSVREIACRMQPATSPLEIRWSSESVDAGDLAPVGWRARVSVPDEDTTLHVLGVAALIDDTIVTISVIGDEPPETADIHALLVEQATLLGVSPTAPTS